MTSRIAEDKIEKRYYSTKEVSELTGISVALVYYYYRKIKTSTLFERPLRISKKEE